MAKTTHASGATSRGSTTTDNNNVVARGKGITIFDGAIGFSDGNGGRDDTFISRASAGVLKISGTIGALSVGTLAASGKITASSDLDVVGTATFFGYAGFGGNIGLGSGVSTIGFYGAAPAAKPTITGSRGGNAALASLLTQLATLGLIADSTTV